MRSRKSGVMAAPSPVPSGQQLERNVMLDKKKTITFMGKLFYMDLPHNKQTQLLSKAIVRRGGVIESFLSRDVNYVVTGNRKAADVTNGEPNGRKGNGSQHPAAENIEKPPYSRGKQLLKKVVQSQECSSVLSSARSWGVCILHLDEVLEYLARLTKRRMNRPSVEKGAVGAAQTIKVGKLKSPFLKIEDQSREYCPIHCSFSNFPECSFISSDRSPFETAPTNNSTHKDPRDQKEGEKPRNWEKIGYCECCQITYQKLSEHLISKQHCRFALKASNYRAIDDLASLIHYDFVPLPPGFKPNEEPYEDKAPPQSLEQPLLKEKEFLEKEEDQQDESKDLPVDLVAERPTEEHGLVLPERHVKQDTACPMENHSLGLSKKPPAENMVIDPAQTGGLLVEDNRPQSTVSTTALVQCDLPLEAAAGSHVGLVTKMSWYTEEAGLTSVYTVQSLVIPPAPGLNQHMAMENLSVQPQLFLSALGDPPFSLAQGGFKNLDNNDQGEATLSTYVEPQIINAVLQQTNALLGDKPHVIPSTGLDSERSSAPATGGECSLQHLDAASSVMAPIVESAVDQHQHVLLVSTQNKLLVNTPCDMPTELTNNLSINQLTLAPWHLSAEDNVTVTPSTAPSVDAQDPEPTVPNVDCGGGKRKHCWSPCQPAGKRQPLSCQPMPLWVLHHLPSSANQPIVPMFSDWVDRDCNNRAAEDEGTTLPTFCYNPKMVQYDASSESDWDSHLASLRHNNPHQTAHFGELRTAQVSLDESCYGKQLCSVLSHEQTLGSPGATQTVTLSHTSCDIFLSGVAS
ncbi:protein DBF4 homolog B isoform X2 [Eleutherodactylus coqui]|uniref:protein DBF4 homolog B isoform X2 n=2 Tax=Eleutherodactylus coqui TaxID=57060 RepID=UPI003462FB2E